MSSPHELSADDVIFIEEEPALGMESRDVGLGQALPLTSYVYFWRVSLGLTFLMWEEGEDGGLDQRFSM